MINAPEWISVATPLASAVAVVVSATSLAISVATYRRAGPRVSVLFLLGDEMDDDFNYVALNFQIVLRNAGLADSNIYGMRLRGFCRQDPLIAVDIPPHESRLNSTAIGGPKLPYALKAGSSQEWRIVVRLREDMLWGNGEPNLEMAVEAAETSTVEVLLGSGKTLKARRPKDVLRMNMRGKRQAMVFAKLFVRDFDKERWGH